MGGAAAVTDNSGILGWLPLPISCEECEETPTAKVDFNFRVRFSGRAGPPTSSDRCTDTTRVPHFRPQIVAPPRGK